MYTEEQSFVPQTGFRTDLIFVAAIVLKAVVHGACVCVGGGGGGGGAVSQAAVPEKHA